MSVDYRRRAFFATSRELSLRHHVTQQTFRRNGYPASCFAARLQWCDNELAYIDRSFRVSTQGRHREQCVLMIPAPADNQIYDCLHSIAAGLVPHVACERLWLEHEVPLSPGLCDPQPPCAIGRVLSHGSSLIARIALEIGGLKLEYVRSGGHDPFRESFFDEVLLAIIGELQLDQQQVQDVLLALYTGLGATVFRGSPLFTDLFESAVQTASARTRIYPLDRISN